MPKIRMYILSRGRRPGEARKSTEAGDSLTGLMNAEIIDMLLHGTLFAIGVFEVFLFWKYCICRTKTTSNFVMISWCVVITIFTCVTGLLFQCIKTTVLGGFIPSRPWIRLVAGTAEFVIMMVLFEICRRIVAEKKK